MFDLVILIVIIIVLICIALYANQAITPSQPSTLYSTESLPGWKIIKENECIAYKYSPTSSVNIPPNPSLMLKSEHVLDEIPQCLDPDVQPSKIVTLECMSSECINNNGQLVPKESRQEVQMACGPTEPCVGRLSGLSIIFKTIPNLQYCVNGHSVEECNPSNVSKYRVTRMRIGDNPSNIIPGRQQTGPLMKIEERDTGKLLMFYPNGNIITTSLKNNSYVGCGSDVGGTIEGEGDVVFSDNVPSDGFVWYYISSFEGRHYLVFIGDIDPSTIPQVNTLNFFIQNGYKALMSASTSQPILMTSLKDIMKQPICARNAISFQYLDIEIYNTLIKF